VIDYIKVMGIDKLSVSERLQLIEQIWDSLPDSVEANDVPAWHLQEVAKRYEYAKAHQGEGKPWLEVMKELEAIG
jgi:putative addiction module component (TIGR02574 family)